MVKLTIGMATYNDFDGSYFTLQTLRTDQNLEHVELRVVRNYCLALSLLSREALASVRCGAARRLGRHPE